MYRGSSALSSNASLSLPTATRRLPSKIDKRILGPQAVSKFLPADYLSGVFQERDEDPIRLLLQLDASPVLQKLPRGGVYLKRTELIDNSGLCLHTWHPKSYRTDEESSLPLRHTG